MSGIKSQIELTISNALTGKKLPVGDLRLRPSQIRAMAKVFVQEQSSRYRTNSTGDGEWPFVNGKEDGIPILIDTGTLLAEVSMRSVQVLSDGFEFRFSDTQHPNFKGTVEELAEIHQQGLGHNKKRTIIHKDGPIFDAILKKLNMIFEQMIDE